MKTKFFLLLAFTLIATEIFSQTQIEYRSDYGFIRPESPNDIVLTKNVVFVHEGMTMHCDSAIYNAKENYFFAFSNINMYQADTIHLTGDELHYYGNDKIGELSGKQVILEDGKLTMQTDYLLLDRNDNTVKYLTGANIWDDKNTLNSKEGIYFIDDKKFLFLYNVELTSPDAVINTDTMSYNTKNKESEFLGQTHILTNDSTKVNALGGTYNTKNDIVFSDKRPQIWTKEQYIVADTIYYDRKLKNGYSKGNIYVEDTTNDMRLNCGSITLNTIDSISTAIIYDSSLVRQINKEDTLYFHSDTMHIVMDTTYNVKDIFAYNHCKFFRSDMQGACEYAHYNKKDSILTMLIRPILWSEESQLTADTIIMKINDKEVEYLNMMPNTFIVQNSDTNTKEYFNQVSGKNLMGYFAKNKLYYAEIDGNTNSIYFVWDENKKKKTKTLTGVNIGTSKLLHLYFNKGKLKQMSAIKNPQFYMDNYENIAENERRLKGFLFKEDDKPTKPQDIFIKRL